MQENSLQLKKNVASKWSSKHLWGVPFILLLTVQNKDTCDVKNSFSLLRPSVILKGRLAKISILK